jgi:hypothetical protein
MKNITFLCGMPRAGNTILGALVNQNKEITLTANSIVPDILHESWKIKHNMSFQNFPDNNALDIYLENIIQNYYSSFKSKFIIDRGPWGTPGNIMLLQKYYKHGLKFIILTRDPLECMASFIKILRVKKNKIEQECENLLKRNNIFGMNVWSIQNLIKESRINTNIKLHFMKYDDLINNPQKELKNLFKFIGILYKPIKEKNFNNFEINGIKYNDNVFSDTYHTNLHDIRTDSISKNKTDILKILPKKIISKYKDSRLF